MMLSKQIRLFLTCISAACALAVFAASAATPPLPPTRSEAMSVPTVLSRADQALYRDAYALAERRRWREALSRAEQATDPLLAKALRWNYYRQRGASVDFGEIAGFLRDNPRWPGASRLQRRAEEVLDDSVSDEVLIAWFSQRRPVTGEAMIRLAETMMRSDMREGGLDWLRYAWTHNTFSRNRSRQLFRRYKSELLETDHQKRLDNLLWKGHRGSARGMLTLVTSDQRRLAEARMALMARARGVDHKVAAVPAALRNDPGLIYERARWRRRAIRPSEPSVVSTLSNSGSLSSCRSLL